MKKVILLAGLSLIAGSAWAMKAPEEAALKNKIITLLATPVNTWTADTLKEAKSAVTKYVRAFPKAGAPYQEVLTQMEAGYVKLQAERKKGEATVKKLQEQLEETGQRLENSLKSFRDRKREIADLQAKGATAAQELEITNKALNDLKDVALNGLTKIRIHAEMGTQNPVQSWYKEIEKDVAELNQKLQPTA